MKEKSATPKKIKSIHNRDVFQRVNFLHQASLLMAEKNSTLSCYYGNLFKQLQKKSVLKM
jgi:ribonuclease P protein subunit RPR2